LRFSIFVSMERLTPGDDMNAVAKHALDLVKLAEEGGFEIAWAAEHHSIELIIGPNPFTLLTHWAAHTSRIRLGTARPGRNRMPRSRMPQVDAAGTSNSTNVRLTRQKS
jgi:hypothetical protein